MLTVVNKIENISAVHVVDVDVVVVQITIGKICSENVLKGCKAVCK
jgi:hypothetical protein